MLGERPVARWVSGRGRAVFEYLVVHRHTRVRRERLMTVFWPDASPEAARNSLNVAIHGLRQSLRVAAGEHPVVIHRDGSYLIEPSLDLWVDTEVFEDLVKSARQHLASDEPAAAQADFHTAIGLYQGPVVGCKKNYTTTFTRPANSVKPGLYQFVVAINHSPQGATTPPPLDQQLTENVGFAQSSPVKFTLTVDESN